MTFVNVFDFLLLPTRYYYQVRLAPYRAHALGDWSHLLVGVTSLLYRRLGLDACLLKVTMRFLQYCLRRESRFLAYRY